MPARSPGLGAGLAARARPGRPLCRPAPGRATAHARGLVLPGAALALIASGLLPREAGWLVALVLVIGLGVPHGALDGVRAAPLLRPRFGRLWFPVFALPYLALAGLVLVAWRVAPLAALAGFLALSVAHFGAEDAGPGRPWEALVRGGLPIALPALLQPAATAEIFAAVARVPLPGLPGWWSALAWAWLAALLAWAALRPPAPRLRRELAALVLAFALLPPLAAFALYFVCLHAPRHMRALVRDPGRPPGLDTVAQAARASLPVFGLTLLIGAALWPLYAGAGGSVGALLALTLQMLSALTVPHVLCEHWAERRARPAPARAA